jgi:hypothetical protein
MAALARYVAVIEKIAFDARVFLINIIMRPVSLCASVLQRNNPEFQ